jgi:hypothetical protein
MVDVQTVSIAIASASVVAGVIYYTLQIRHQTKTRQTDMVMRLYATFGSTEFQRAYQNVASLEYEDYADYVKRYAKDVEVRAGMWTVTVFFEGIGVLARRRLIKMELVEDLFGYPVLRTWKKVASVVKGLREVEKAPGICEWFEYLYNELKKRKQSK